MARSAGPGRSLQRIERICASPDDGRALREQLVDEVRRTVPFDAYAWPITDPETSVGTAPLADVPCLPELPTLIRLRYVTALNRWTSLSNPPVATLHAATGGDLAQSKLWRELLQRFDIRDVATTVFRDRFGCWGFLDLWRAAPGVPFTAGETAFLADLAEPVTHALRAAQAATFAEGSAPGESPGPVVLLLAPDLTVRAQTPSTRDYLHTLLPNAADRAPIPASAYNVAAQLLALEAGVDDNAASARVHLSGGRWVTLRAARIGDVGTDGAGADDELSRGEDIAVTIEDTTTDERLRVFSRAFGLSPREDELLTLLATGRDTRELGRSMFLSEHTVQDHLKSIFAKTSAPNRRALLARAAGT